MAHVGRTNITTNMINTIHSTQVVTQQTIQPTGGQNIHTIKIMSPTITTRAINVEVITTHKMASTPNVNMHPNPNDTIHNVGIPVQTKITATPTQSGIAIQHINKIIIPTPPNTIIATLPITTITNRIKQIMIIITATIIIIPIPMAITGAEHVQKITLIIKIIQRIGKQT